MAAKIYYQEDCNLSLLEGKTIAVIGYGSQGHSQAQNLRDSGVDVIVAELKGTPNYKIALDHGFKPVSASEASKKADMIQILAQDNLRSVEVIDFPELGMEAVWKIDVVDFPAFVVVDDKGNDFFEDTLRPVALTIQVGPPADSG